ncbi:MAG TPA: TDP-N-acetylfucosamine:lipid II N-acetylfucosaminyltransferase [Acinetobacter lwoffii]|uniref:TDP-N-acetylfucosamine:lipid II N-acetylfucosaminyltransferase n=1 Tax=Acinetobacter lwoffii TaxID=28090 RepID=A0A9D2USB1_ACILW|nr:TDP-N-acetylfucosamine:lipid II N-acetylfucosaminyltransferase [Acinetobacter lwoffii]
MYKKIIHVGMADKFLPALIDFIQKNFSPENNTFYLYGDENVYGFLRDRGVFFLGEKENNVSYFQLLLEMYSADKIILHGLFSSKVIKILFYNPWLLKKCHWLMWGGDLYETKQKNGLSGYYKKIVIKNMGYLLTYLPGDIEYARAKFRAKGKYLENLGYLSNIFSLDHYSDKNNSENINILLGNSADPANEHIAALDILEQFKDSNIKIYVPLSYGNQIYAEKVIKYGKTIFEHKFEALTEFMPYEKYQSFLQNIDIAIFNHQRQQAMGNTISLLGMGKIVYLRKGTSQWELFKDKDIEVFDIETFNLTNTQKLVKNQSKIKSYFSKENFEKKWKKLLES